MIVRVRSKDAFEILINGHEQIFVVLESLFHLKRGPMFCRILIVTSPDNTIMDEKILLR